MARGGKRPGAGRPPGSKEKHTLEREAQMERVRQRVFAATDTLIDSQMLLAKGLTFVYRVTTGARGGRSDPELVTNQDELHEAIDAIHAGGGYGEILEDEGGEEGEQITRRYYFLSTKAPDNKSIDSLLDRAYGKATQPVSGPDGGPLEANLSESDRKAITGLRNLLKQRAA